MEKKVFVFTYKNVKYTCKICLYIHIYIYIYTQVIKLKIE